MRASSRMGWGAFVLVRPRIGHRSGWRSGDGGGEMDVTIRPIRMEDAEDLLALANMPGVRWGTTRTGALTMMEQRRWLEGFATGANQYCLGAEVDGRVVGTVHLIGATGPRTRHIAHLGMMVRDDYAGRGVGTALLVATLDLADNWIGFHRIELDVMVDNMPAIRLYERHGFVREGTYRDKVLREGRYINCYAMARIRGVIDEVGAH
jgi:putative acetyltransferase